MGELFSVITAEMDVATAIRQRVTDLLKETGLSQAALAKAISQHPSVISEFLAGKRDINTIRTLLRIARFFGVSVSYLIQETKEESALDAQTAKLLATWRQLRTPDRELLTKMAEAIQERAQRDVPPNEAPPDAG